MTERFSARDYWQSRLSQSYSLQGVGYQRLGRSFNKWMYRLRARVFARVAARMGVDWSQARVLDVGSGTGFYVDLWHRLGVPKVRGVDITPKAVEELRRCFPGDDFHEADVGAVDGLGATGDGLPLTAHRSPLTAVSAMDVLFHIVDDVAYRRAFSNIASALQPRGWLIWSDNFLHHGTERVTHQASRSLGESEDAVRAAGFEIVERVPMFVLMNYPADTTSRLARLAWTAMVSPAALAEPLGWLVGAGLYPVDLVLTSLCRESPTTEIMVCRKTG